MIFGLFSMDMATRTGVTIRRLLERVGLVWPTGIALGLVGLGALGEGPWRLLIGVTAAVVLVKSSGARGSRRWNKALVALAIASTIHAAGPELWRFATSPWVRVWNVYHYYLGSKYFAELGYHDLYVASLVADRGGYWDEIDELRDLRTYEVVPRAAATARYRPLDHFSPARWESFQRDVGALQKFRPPDRWRGIFRDRGYNPPPLWTTVGGMLARLPADRLWALKLLCSLDLVLLAATFGLIGRTFGARVLAVVLLLFTLSPVNEGRLVGNFLGYDWFCAVAMGLVFLRRRRTLPAILALAYAAGTRIFPAILVASAGAALVTAWIRRGSVPRRDLRLVAGLTLAGGLAFGISIAGAGSVDRWRAFVDNIAHHNQEHRVGQQRIGLAHALSRDVRNLDFRDHGRRAAAEMASRQQPLTMIVGGLLLTLWGLAIFRRNVSDAFLLGMIPLFVLAVSSRYYWSVLALLPLLARPGPMASRRVDALASGQLAMLAFLGLAMARGFQGFALYTLFGLLLAGYLVAVGTTVSLRDLAVWRRHLPLTAWYRSRVLAGVGLAALFLFLCWLRLPHPDIPIRDVDEAVSALIAANWLDGGVPYRDAIDQRGPVTYAIYALVFALTGVHDMQAVHWALLFLILVTCLVVFRLGRSLRAGGIGFAVGSVAAALVAIATFTYRRSQMLAFHTEWPLMLASAVAMLALWHGLRSSRAAWFVGAGAAFAIGFLSKQPGIFDAGAGALFVLMWQHERGALFGKTTLRFAAWLAVGFFSTLAGTALYFASHGAWGDFLLYYWTYNVDHYTAVVPMSDRLAALDPFAHGRHYLTANPVLLVGSLVAGALAIAAWLRCRRVDGRLLLTLWMILGYFGASYSGRNFGHYFIQIIVPACLLTAMALVDVWRWSRPGAGRWLGRADIAVASRAVVVVLTVVGSIAPLVRFHGEIAGLNLWRDRPQHHARARLLDAIRSRTKPEDTIFVWGYYPELYVLAPRRPASRYSNTNYLTGMLPWENHQPGVDTSAHIVDGAWDILLDELEANRPALVVDTAVGDHRYYAKYPIAERPRLLRFLAAGYTAAEVVEDRRGRPVAALWVRR